MGPSIRVYLTGWLCLGPRLGLAVLLVAHSGPAAQPAALVRYETTQAEMGVPFKLILYAPDQATANRASQAVFARIEAVQPDHERLRPQQRIEPFERHRAVARSRLP